MDREHPYSHGYQQKAAVTREEVVNGTMQETSCVGVLTAGFTTPVEALAEGSRRVVVQESQLISRAHVWFPLSAARVRG